MGNECGMSTKAQATVRAHIAHGIAHQNVTIDTVFKSDVDGKEIDSKSRAQCGSASCPY